MNLLLVIQVSLAVDKSLTTNLTGNIIGMILFNVLVQIFLFQITVSASFAIDEFVWMKIFAVNAQLMSEVKRLTALFARNGSGVIVSFLKVMKQNVVFGEALGTERTFEKFDRAIVLFCPCQARFSNIDV